MFTTSFLQCICPRDRLRLGMQWNNAVYVDGMLPFGLRSAPKTFNALADGLEWCIFKEGVQHNYFSLPRRFYRLRPSRVIRMRGESPCPQTNMQRTKHPPSRGENISHNLPGHNYDTDRRELRLPVDKLQRLMEEIH